MKKDAIWEDIGKVAIDVYIKYVISNSEDLEKGIDSINNSSNNFFRRSDVV